MDNFKSQHRGGKGIKGIKTIEDDFIEDLFMTKNQLYYVLLQTKEEYID